MGWSGELFFVLARAWGRLSPDNSMGCVVDDAVEKGVGVNRIADNFVPGRPFGSSEGSSLDASLISKLGDQTCPTRSRFESAIKIALAFGHRESAW